MFLHSSERIEESLEDTSTYGLNGRIGINLLKPSGNFAYDQV
jgi:hypothetical protein